MSTLHDLPRDRTEAGLATIRPRYGQASLADVMPSALAALRGTGADPLALADVLEGVRAVVVLLIDGLGHQLLPLAAPHAPTLADLAAGGVPGVVTRVITAPFPSTTPTSLTTLGTGAAPGEHGLLGFFVRVPGTSQVLNHIAWRGDPDPLRWQPLATQFQIATTFGVTAHVVSRPEYDGSGLTMAAFRGGAYRGAAGADALADGLLALLTSVSGPTLVYAYHPDVDAAGHIYGVDSPQWRLAVADVDRLLTRLVDGIPSGTALVLTADHGQLDIPVDHRFDLDLDERLRAGVEVVAGEPRVRYLHTVPGATDDVIAAWREVLGGAAWVGPRDELISEGWFGPVPEEHLQRIGDVVVVCHDTYAVLASSTDPPTVARLVAFHGSSTEAEMLVPLIVVRRR